MSFLIMAVAALALAGISYLIRTSALNVVVKMILDLGVFLVVLQVLPLKSLMLTILFLAMYMGALYMLPWHKVFKD